MNEIKIRIDYNADPDLDNKAKQVVYIEKTFEELDIRNLIGKTISNVEYESFHNCLVLTLTEDIVMENISDS
jgi:hypothetical protein